MGCGVRAIFSDLGKNRDNLRIFYRSRMVTSGFSVLDFEAVKTKNHPLYGKIPSSEADHTPHVQGWTNHSS
jgi:hypothetical protein